MLLVSGVEPDSLGLERIADEAAGIFDSADIVVGLVHSYKFIIKSSKV